MISLAIKIFLYIVTCFLLKKVSKIPKVNDIHFSSVSQSNITLTFQKKGYITPYAVHRSRDI